MDKATTVRRAGLLKLFTDSLSKPGPIGIASAFGLTLIVLIDTLDSRLSGIDSAIMELRDSLRARL